MPKIDPFQKRSLFSKIQVGYVLSTTKNMGFAEK
jgi:hypothetical protein